MQLVADNLTVTNPTVASAIAALEPAPIQQMVDRCLEAGANAIDINPGPLPRRAEATMTFLVETVQERTPLPLVLDSTNPIALEAGLKACRNQAIINGFSLEPSKLENILPLAAAYDADIIGYLLHPDSQVPVDTTQMMETALALYERYSESGLPLKRLIIDPVIVPVSWENGLVHNRAVLTTIRSLPELIGEPVRTIAGLSNLSSGAVALPRKRSLEAAFLPMLAAAGLDLALLNMRHGASVQTAAVCNALLGERIFTWAEIPAAARQADVPTRPETS